MFIYISGPYSPPQEKTPEAQQKIVGANIERAEQVAVELTKKGHIPFVPHTMMRGWEDENKVSREEAMNVCHKWIEKCDALFFLGSSKGAESERKVAVERGIPIYRYLRDVPVASDDPPIAGISTTGTTSMETRTKPRLSPEAIQGLTTEYEQCMDSYRHTYATIWQAGGIFIAISAAIVAFGTKVADQCNRRRFRLGFSFLRRCHFCFGGGGYFSR
jgi:hypothetical protein